MKSHFEGRLRMGNLIRAWTGAEKNQDLKLRNFQEHEEETMILEMKAKTLSKIGGHHGPDNNYCTHESHDNYDKKRKKEFTCIQFRRWDKDLIKETVNKQ